jgi:thiol:disulfide interchange protein
MRIGEPLGKVMLALRTFLGRHERLLWIGLFAVALLVQWPMLKGYYYRAVGTPVPRASIAWRTDLNAALAEAGRTKKQVLVDFSADWCPPCIAMKHDVWPDAEVGRALARSYVPLLVDVDRNGEVAARYNVDGIPTVLVLDGAGRVVRQANFLSARSAAAMVAFLTEKE